MSEETKYDERPVETVERQTRRGSRSLFAPIVMISAGVFFLLDNLGILPPLDWQAAMRFWPLALIFLGLNVLVVQARPPLGSILSLLVALAAVAAFGYLLLTGSPDSALRAAGIAGGRELRDESFTLTPGDARAAAVTLRLGNYNTEIAAGNPVNLVSGTIWTRTGLDMKPSSNASGLYSIELGELPGSFVVNPFEWADGDHTWQFFLSPALPLDLEIDGSNGRVTADLSDLALTGLVMDGGNGPLTVRLPAGDYDLRLDGGNGPVTFMLPEGVAARVEYNKGNGGLRVDRRFERVSGDADEGVYETADFKTAAETIRMRLDTGNGSVTITTP